MFSLDFVGSERPFCIKSPIAKGKNGRLKLSKLLNLNLKITENSGITAMECWTADPTKAGKGSVRPNNAK